MSALQELGDAHSWSPGAHTGLIRGTEGLVHFTTQWGFQTLSRCHSGLAGRCKSTRGTGAHTSWEELAHKLQEAGDPGIRLPQTPGDPHTGQSIGQFCLIPGSSHWTSFVPFSIFTALKSQPAFLYFVCFFVVEEDGGLQKGSKNVLLLISKETQHSEFVLHTSLYVPLAPQSLQKEKTL